MAQAQKLTVALLAWVVLAGCTTAATREDTADALDGVLAGNQRSDEDRARDRYRHPRETLLFFGLRPQMRVLEVSPEPGWYTSVLAPLLSRHGQYYAAVDAPQNEETREQLSAFRQKLASRPDVYGHVSVVPFPLEGGVRPGTLDLVVCFGNARSWLEGNAGPEVLASLFSALKPGGALGVVGLRSPPMSNGTLTTANRVGEDDVITRIESAGFRLVAKSQVNSSARDPREPALAESNRFTLKFIKPLRSARR
jgi:predicted methyltransferase